MDPLVSVIIPTRNRAQSLMNAIKSVLCQSFQNFEIIIINDASTDNTQEMVERLQSQDHRIHLISNAHPLGGAQSRNCGIEKSRGTWLAFLDDDDKWLPNKLAKQLQALTHTPKAIACSSAYRVNYPFHIKRQVMTPHFPSYEMILRANTLGGASVCICKAAVLKDIGGFDAKLRSAQDWDVWLRLRTQGDIISIAVPLVEYQVHFQLRISNDMRAKYAGAKRFYFKHKHAMGEDIRKQNLSFICFIQSRQKFRSLPTRLKKLALAVKYSAKETKVKYLISSLMRMV